MCLKFEKAIDGLELGTALIKSNLKINPELRCCAEGLRKSRRYIGVHIDGSINEACYLMGGHIHITGQRGRTDLKRLHKFMI